jgi:hypothetical protein
MIHVLFRFAITLQLDNTYQSNGTPMNHFMNLLCTSIYGSLIRKPY